MLTQEQLNAAVLISALADVAAINTDERYGFGRETLALVREHVRGWDMPTRRNLRHAIDRIFAPPASDSAVDPGVADPGTPTPRDESSSSSNSRALPSEGTPE